VDTSILPVLRCWILNLALFRLVPALFGCPPAKRRQGRRLLPPVARVWFRVDFEEDEAGMGNRLRRWTPATDPSDLTAASLIAGSRQQERPANAQ
jgi:hypothetical protein